MCQLLCPHRCSVHGLLRGTAHPPTSGRGRHSSGSYSGSDERVRETIWLQPLQELQSAAETAQCQRSAWLVTYGYIHVVFIRVLTSQNKSSLRQTAAAANFKVAISLENCFFKP